MKIQVIKSNSEYELALKNIDKLLDAPENSEEVKQLELLSILVEDYENKHYAITSPDPITAINIRLEQLGLTRKDLQKTLGTGRGRISEILNKKRNLTLAMIRKLNKDLKIPADILIS